MKRKNEESHIKKRRKRTWKKEYAESHIKKRDENKHEKTSRILYIRKWKK